MSVKIFGNGKIEGVAVDKKRIEAFTGSGTFTVPAGVTYAIAHMLGGGGGIGTEVTAGEGGDSSVAFVSGTVTSLGASKVGTSTGTLPNPQAGKANSGNGATNGFRMDQPQVSGIPQNGQWIVAGAAVTPADDITVTVGAGGSAGTDGAAGGSGYVYIEYFEEV